MSHKLGVCIVGCGYMGRIHAERWNRFPGAAVVAVVDVRPERAFQLAKQLNCRSYLDYREAVVQPDVDVVSVCIPTSLHAGVTIFAAENGKDVLCEKPIALTLEDADRMIAAARHNDIRFGLGFMRRHSPVLEDLRDLLSGGHFGRPVLYHAADVRELRPKREMHDARANGGPVIDMAVHLIDLWAAIFQSRCLSVSAGGLKLAAERPELGHIDESAVDTAVIIATYESGDIGSFVVTWGLPPKVNPPESSDRIFGPAGLGEVYYQMGRQELRGMAEGGRWETLSICHQDMYQNQINNFAESILSGAPVAAGGEAGRSALRVALAALESIRTRRSVDLS